MSKGEKSKLKGRLLLLSGSLWFWRIHLATDPAMFSVVRVPSPQSCRLHSIPVPRFPPIQEQEKFKVLRTNLKFLKSLHKCKDEESNHNCLRLTIIPEKTTKQNKQKP